MIKCVSFDKTEACWVVFFLVFCFFFFSERNGALLSSLMLKKMQTSYGNLQMSASLQTQVFMVWGQVLVNLQLKCARGIVAGGGGGCLSPAPCSTSQRHTHRHTQSVPKTMNAPSPGVSLPPKISERSTRFRTYAYTALSYALVVLFMPVSRMLHLTQ